MYLPETPWIGHNSDLIPALQKCSHHSKAGTVIINLTPHPLSLLDVDGTIHEVPCDMSLVVNAIPHDEEFGPNLVRTVWKQSDFAKTILNTARTLFKQAWANGALFLVGSKLAADCYSEVVCLIPATGDRGGERLYRTDLFNVGTV